jgi:hypothetical protein
MTAIREAPVTTGKAEEPIRIGEAAGGKPSRLKLLVGAALAVLVLVVAVPRVFGGGSGGVDVNGLSAPPVTPPTTAAPSSPSTAAVVGSVRDPFAVPAALRPSAGATTADPSTVSSPGAGNPAGTTASTATTAPPSTGPSSSSIRFFLWEVTDGPRAIVGVNDEKIDVGVDDTFLGSYRVVSLDLASRCGVFVYGDRRIALCEGQESIL